MRLQKTGIYKLSVFLINEKSTVLRTPRLTGRAENKQPQNNRQ